MKKLIFILGGTALLLLAMIFGALFALPLFASAHSSSTSATAAPTATSNYCQQYLQDLSKRLGVSVSTLQSDKLAAAKDVLAQMVKDGKLTQKEADAITQRLESHQACSGNGQGLAGNALVLQALRPYLPDMATQVAQGLHLSVAQLKADLQAGQSLSQVATKQGVSSAQLHTIVMNAIQSDLNKAVSAGSITQQQATTFTQELQSHPQLLNRILNGQIGKGVTAAPQS